MLLVKIEFLQKQFRTIKEEFFPRWDKKQEWGVRLSRDKELSPALGDTAVGQCNSESKNIVIQSIDDFSPVGRRIADIKMIIFSSCTKKLSPKQQLQLLLIHEICHAVTPDGHGKRFQKRLLKASERAKELGRKRLANALREEAGEMKYVDRFDKEERIKRKRLLEIVNRKG
jgi:hypothetical protein